MRGMMVALVAVVVLSYMEEVERVKWQSVWISFTNVTDWKRAHYISVRFDFRTYLYAPNRGRCFRREHA